MLYFVKDSPEHRLTQSHWSTNTQSQEEAEEAGISKCSKYVYLYISRLKFVLPVDVFASAYI